MAMSSPQVDLKIAALPPSVFDFIMKNLAANIISMLAKEAVKFEPGGKASFGLSFHNKGFDGLCSCC